MQFAYKNATRFGHRTRALSSPGLTTPRELHPQEALKKFRSYQLFENAKWIVNLQAWLVRSGRATTAGQIQFSFQLPPEYERYAQLLRGLMALSGTRHAQTSFSLENRVFHMVIDLAGEKSAVRHLEKALALFGEEIAFRNKLENVLKIERKLRDEISALYADW